MQSKTKSNTASSQPSSLGTRIIGTKNRQDLLRSQQTEDSFSSFDATQLM